ETNPGQRTGSNRMVRQGFAPGDRQRPGEGSRTAQRHGLPRTTVVRPGAGDHASPKGDEPGGTGVDAAQRASGRAAEATNPLAGTVAPAVSLGVEQSVRFALRPPQRA